jgi:hypothetical protein
MSAHASGQNKKRAAVRSAVHRHKLFISSRTYAGGRGMMSARVLVDGEAYEVNARQLELLEKGKMPSDLTLEPEPH